LDWSKVIFWFVFVSLVGAVIYATVRTFLAPSGAVVDYPHEKLKSDYILMLVQSILGIVVIFLPSILIRRLNFNIPRAALITYFIFLYCAIPLGEVQSFYYHFRFWDDILHFLSGGMLAILGFIIVDTLNRQKKIQVILSPLFVALFAFCFALAIGTLWEVWEFTFDSILGLNMQKFATETGQALVGQAALRDTMKDLIVDAVAALGVSGSYYVLELRKRKVGSSTS
jgi:uncharacterized membrane protein YjdF